MISDGKPRSWILVCGHKRELNRWEEMLTDRHEIPEEAECNFCGGHGAVQHVAAAPSQGEYKLGDTASVYRVEGGLFRWERRGRRGELVDVSEDFRYERDAVMDAGAHNRDVFDRR